MLSRSGSSNRSLARDAGASGLEYGALIMVGAMVLGALAFLTVPNGLFGQNVEYAICKLFNGERECESPADKALKPTACTTVSSTQTYGATVDIAFFQAGKEITFIRATDSTGKVTVTAVNSSALGVGTGVGAGVNWGNAINIGADADARANIKGGIGDSWVFNSQAEADKFIGEIQHRAKIDGVKQTGVIGWLGGKIVETVDPPEVRDPDINRYEIELNGNAGINAGISIGPGKKNKDGDRAKRGDEDSDGNPITDTRGDNKLKPNLSGYVSVDAKGKAIVEKDKRDGSTSVTVEVGGGAKAGGNYIIENKEVRGQVAGSVKLTYDKDGKLTKMTLVRTAVVNNELSTTTTELPITTDAERAAVYHHLGADSLGANGIPAATPLKLTWDDMAPVSPPGPNATPLQKLLFDKGKTQKVDYDYSATDQAYGANVKLGLKLGAGVTVANRDQKAKNAEYLGATGTNGERQWKRYKECKS
ncbi:hypothetical protein [Spirillospora sp. CA-294931]|uniref:hypothetical protein n=1 Tax=Spirillospora sp. CA-294931 TaxID=3240042 RepID=UPI003D8C8E15